MSQSRDERNEKVRKRYAELRHSGLKFFDAIEALEESPENKEWCLKFDTIRLIVSYKLYGKSKAQRRQLRNQGK